MVYLSFQYRQWKFIWQTLNMETHIKRWEHKRRHSRRTHAGSVRECGAWVFKVVNAFLICSPLGDSSSPYERISVGLSVESSMWHWHSYHSLGVPIKIHPCQESNSSPTIPALQHTHACTMHVHTYTSRWQTTNTVRLTMMDGVHNLAGGIDFG